MVPTGGGHLSASPPDKSVPVALSSGKALVVRATAPVVPGKRLPRSPTKNAVAPTPANPAPSGATTGGRTTPKLIGAATNNLIAHPDALAKTSSVLVVVVHVVIASTTRSHNCRTLKNESHDTLAEKRGKKHCPPVPVDSGNNSKEFPIDLFATAVVVEAPFDAERNCATLTIIAGGEGASHVPKLDRAIA